MSNTFGKHITVTLFGESHGPAIGAVIDGLPAGIPVDEAFILKQMQKRKASGSISTSRREDDLPQFLSGIRNGYTEGTPVSLIIPNNNVNRKDYDNIALVPRPSHADYTGHIKYSGFEDASGGGHFSGRLTAPLVAAGAICLNALEKKGIDIGTHILNLHGIKDDSFQDMEEEIRLLNEKTFPVLNSEAEEKMIREIEDARDKKDSVGGILETVVTGLEAGIGEPFFDSLESSIAHGVFSIPAVKGISFGAGFGFAEMYGSEANDPFAIEEGKVVTMSNHNGGINGGISNGMPILFQTVIKPTPSISQPQKSVNLGTMEETELVIQGRHDPAIIHRARVVVDSVTALVIMDQLLERHGSLWFQEH